MYMYIYIYIYTYFIYITRAGESSANGSRAGGSQAGGSPWASLILSNAGTCLIRPHLFYALYSVNECQQLQYVGKLFVAVEENLR